MCGKYSANSQSALAFLGSPPHVREILYQNSKPHCDHEDHPRMCGKYFTFPFFVMFCIRITPACAGNTPKITILTHVLKDHPRMCGKYIMPTEKVTTPTRITPACAGNTQCHCYHLVLS